MTPENIRHGILEATKEAAVAFVEDMEHIRAVLVREGASTDEIRRLSGVLRRLLCDGDIGRVAAPRIGKVRMLRIPDNDDIYAMARRMRLEMFASFGATVFGMDCRLLAFELEYTHLVSPEIFALALPPDHNPNKTKDVNIDQFLSQRVMCLRGRWVNRRAVIKYVAQVASGVHSDTPGDEQEVTLSELRRSRFSLNDKGIAMDMISDSDREKNARFTLLSKNSIDPVSVELLSAAHWLSVSPDVTRLEEVVRREIVLA